VIHGGRYQPIDPEANFDLPRFAALQRYHAQLGREVSRTLRELRLLKAEPLATITPVRNEPEPASAAASSPAAPNEPQPRLPAAASRRDSTAQNEPEPAPPPAGQQPATPAQPPTAARRGPAPATATPVDRLGTAASCRGPSTPRDTSSPFGDLARAG
jgi:hypothetical protein